VGHVTGAEGGLGIDVKLKPKSKATNKPRREAADSTPGGS